MQTPVVFTISTVDSRNFYLQKKGGIFCSVFKWVVPRNSDFVLSSKKTFAMEKSQELQQWWQETNFCWVMGVNFFKVINCRCFYIFLRLLIEESQEMPQWKSKLWMLIFLVNHCSLSLQLFTFVDQYWQIKCCRCITTVHV